jgi:hypothetical protein
LKKWMLPLVSKPKVPIRWKCLRATGTVKDAGFYGAANIRDGSPT